MKREDTPNHVHELNSFLHPNAKQTLLNRKLNNQESESVDGEFTYEEMTVAVKTLKMSSAPGPDGIPAKILKLMWKFIKIPLTNTINGHLNRKQLPDDYLTAKLRLIPKKGDSTLMKNWRPITVLNSKYKLLS